MPSKKSSKKKTLRERLAKQAEEEEEEVNMSPQYDDEEDSDATDEDVDEKTVAPLCPAAKKELKAGRITVDRWRELQRMVPERLWRSVVDTRLDAQVSSLGIQLSMHKSAENENAKKLNQLPPDVLQKIESLEKDEKLEDQRARIIQWFDRKTQVNEDTREELADEMESVVAEFASMDLSEMSYDKLFNVKARKTNKERLAKRKGSKGSKGSKDKHRLSDTMDAKFTETLGSMDVNDPTNYPRVADVRRLALHTSLLLLKGELGLTPFHLSQMFHCQPQFMVIKFLEFIDRNLSGYHQKIKQAEQAKPSEVKRFAEENEEKPGQMDTKGVKYYMEKAAAEHVHDTIDVLAQAAETIHDQQKHNRKAEADLEFHARDIQYTWRKAIEAAQAGASLEDVEDLMDQQAYLSVLQMAPARRVMPDMQLKNEVGKLEESPMAYRQQVLDTPLHVVMDNTLLSPNEAKALGAEKTIWFQSQRKKLWLAMTEYRYYPDWLRVAAKEAKTALQKLSKNASLEARREAQAPLVAALYTHFYDFTSHIAPELRVRWLTDNFLDSKQVEEFMLTPEQAKLVMGDVFHAQQSDEFVRKEYKEIGLKKLKEDQEALKRMVKEEEELNAESHQNRSFEATTNVRKELEKLDKKIRKFQKVKKVRSIRLRETAPAMDLTNLLNIAFKQNGRTVTEQEARAIAQTPAIQTATRVLTATAGGTYWPQRPRFWLMGPSRPMGRLYF